MSRPLARYREKRNFTATAEPRGSDAVVAKRRKSRALVFVVQKHAASHLHFDLRLEVDGVMKSWAVPKGPSYDPDVKRLAMEVEDHPMEYNSFEGTIPRGQYGGGTVMLWDRGTYAPDEQLPNESASKAVRRGLHAGKLSFTFHGERLQGSFTLIRTRRSDAGERSQWILLKHRDEAARPGSDIVAEVSTSVESGRTLEQIAAGGSAVWHSNRDQEELKGVLEGFGDGAIEPMLPTPARKLGDGIWAVEPHLNGRRALAFAANGVAQLVPLDGGDAFGDGAETTSILRSLTSIARSREGPLVLDGFVEPQEGSTDLSYVATDVLVDDRALLLDQPYIERRLRLDQTLGKAVGASKGALRVPELFLATADDMEAVSTELGTSAVIVKRIDSPYESGESEYWHILDAKHAPSNIGDTKAMTIPASRKDATVKDGDRDVSLTNLTKPFWPELGITKGDLLQYYADVAPYLLPHVVDRAMVMKRYPHGAAGEFFFMKRAPEPRPDWIETCAITHPKSVIDFPMVQNLASLLWVINLGCIDLNPWYSRCDDIDRPDFLHFDLDPVPGADFSKVRETALQLRVLLDELNLPSYPKTSGSKGIHVYIPIIRGPLQKQVWTIAKAIAQEMEKRHPELVTAEYRIAKRPEGRVLVDYNQNAWGRTLASVYSVRPRPSATVSVPVTWEEIEQGVEIESFTLRTVPQRLAEVGDLWSPLLATEGRVQLENIL